MPATANSAAAEVKTSSLTGSLRECMRAKHDPIDGVLDKAAVASMAMS